MSKKQIEKKCRFEACFNALGMVMFKCKVHPQIEEKYLQGICIQTLLRKFKGMEL